MIADDNTTVVSYINKQGGTLFISLLHLVVELFLWLHTHTHTHTGLSVCKPDTVLCDKPSNQVVGIGVRVWYPPYHSVENFEMVSLKTIIPRHLLAVFNCIILFDNEP